jgi:hypothetical protein
MSRTIVLLVVLGTVAGPLVAQNNHPTPPPVARALPLQGAIQLDGRLDEPIWQSAPAATGLRQAQPHEGQPATQRTEVRFTFDGAALYVGARMYDDSGARGVRTRLVRRDADASSDYIQVIFDTYHDHIGRLFFLVNPSGVKNDANGLGGGGDPSWDPVWEVQTAIDSLGWTAEMRIPFSQLRYPSTAEAQTWGLQIWRQENRLNELSMWSFWGSQETGGPPRFGHLEGLVITRPPGRAELLPYVVGRSANIPGDAADPFFDPHALDGRVGVDATLRVTSNLTLNATVNPDFGQVEVDPAVVNLTAFETFFAERRPFFVEGAGYFGLGGFNCFFCSNVSSLSMISTRRIGRPPQISARRAGLTVPVEFADVPENSTILGALKLTGRTPTGWSIGALDAVTRREWATVQDTLGVRQRFAVEPSTNYFAGRVAKDLRGGATQIKAMATSVFRDLEEPYVAARLSRHAETVGVSSDMWWRKRQYRLMMQLAGTQVVGDTAAIRRITYSSRHFFQRPDRSDTTLARPRTSIRGLGGYARFSRESGKVLFEASTNFRTPAFDNNDITFFQRADYWWMGANVVPLWTKPSTWYRQLFLIGGAQQEYNFDGDLTNRQMHAYAEMQTLGYWSISTFFIHQPEVFDAGLTRGGPVVRRSGSDFVAANVSTDQRKKVVLRLNTNRGCSREGYCDYSASLSAELRPRSNVSLSLGPSIGHSEDAAQFVDTIPDSTATAFSGTRYIFADLVQNQISMETRFNVTFTPNLTFELFVQPFIVSADFSRFKEFAAPRGLRKLVYGEDMGTSTPVATGDSLDPDGAGPSGFVIPPRDFTFRSLRGNAVLRWEYRPGSTIFVVWTRSGDSSVGRGAIDFGNDARSLLRGPSANVFLIKVNYWLGL